ncbi:hypothetical protein [Acidobacterium sp. S8]|uniref:hypothetical protein n=1 Tax=Acidobacterium sp. S8 TaxID=1641854 RepID=UPI00131C83D1|nr:hypothetical protein [Acidobacterium sp. S8]
MSFCQTNAAGANAAAQTAQVPAKPSDIMQPALNNVSHTMAGLNISRWKAPGEVRSATQDNTTSIQHDLSNTLPGLLATADAAPTQVSAVFPVYRNIDALYDVLLRVSQTAELAAPQNEANSVADALHTLESARTELGNMIVNISKTAEEEAIKLRAAVQQAATVQPAAPAKTTVVNDGPAKPASTTKKKKKPVTPPATPPDQQPQ